MPFPKNFVWGAATSSYQIEGAALEDGRGECIWTRFSHQPGKVTNNDTGDVACDHYHRYRDDVALMREIGLNAYRFSTSWPRVLPQGTGTVNQAGLDFYNRLVDALLEAGIEPYVTLYHWDLPQALQDQGGWTSPQIIEWFGEYTALMARALGDRVKYWATFNEPSVVTFAGYGSSEMAPGTDDPAAAITAAHHLLLAHGAAVPIIRQQVADAQVGIVLDIHRLEPATDSEADRQATALAIAGSQLIWLEPLFNGHYPELVMKYAAQHDIGGIDLAAVAAANVPLDYLGINYYMRMLHSYDESSKYGTRVVPNDAAEHTAMGWEIYPAGLTKNLVELTGKYSPAALYITENGAAFDDEPSQNGVVEDPRRVAYYAAHLDAVEAAIEQGAPVKGYFAWSLMDNFEWANGYSKRFGIVYVDFNSLQRTLKRSALYYRDRIRQSSG